MPIFNNITVEISKETIFIPMIFIISLFSLVVLSWVLFESNQHISTSVCTSRLQAKAILVYSNQRCYIHKQESTLSGKLLLDVFLYISLVARWLPDCAALYDNSLIHTY